MSRHITFRATDEEVEWLEQIKAKTGTGWTALMRATIALGQREEKFILTTLKEKK